MYLNPMRVREQSTIVSCRLDNVVTLQKEGDSIEFVVWQLQTQCCGPRGIFPVWTREPSTCPGPKECSLLQAGELFYPPDMSIWLPIQGTDGWGEIKSGFILQENCECILPDEVILHIEEIQRKWGIGIDI